MKRFKSLLLVLATMLVAISCQKEYSLEDASGSAVGTLQQDGFGDCLPGAANGIYKVDSTLGSQNYIDVQVNATSTGAYFITTDTLNGFSFRGNGSFASTGINTVRLQGSGKPLATGTNMFTVKFGTTNCRIGVSVLAANAQVGAYTVAGAPGNCSGAVVAGVYKQGTPLNFNNTVSLSVNVTSLGSYSIGTTSVNGMIFQSSGSFVTLGAQTITLEGQGTPTAAGTFNIAAGNAPNACTFSVTVTAATNTAAAFTLGGAPNACTGVVLSGTYQAGLASTASNTAKIDVTVTTVGNYNITTNAVNGVTFSGAGAFTTTGAQTVTLTASGTPAAANTSNYTVTAGTSTCTFSVTYTAAAPPAVYTLGGAPAACTGAVVSGTYAAGTPLAASNTVTITANVTTAGSYTITTATVNGMTFSASGVFSTTGANTIVLAGSGTPTASGNNTFNPQIGTSSCSFVVTVSGTAPVNIITAKINGVFTTFNENILVEFDNTPDSAFLAIEGESLTTAAFPAIGVFVGKGIGTITTGTYNVNQLATGVGVGAYYLDAANVEYIAETALLPQSPAFTIVITSITANRIMGTFTGPVKDNAGAGPGVKTITEGTFSVAY